MKRYTLGEGNALAEQCCATTDELLMKRYTFADINRTDEKPLITKEVRVFRTTRYRYACRGRGSEGWGYTPEQAYQHWHRNWTRRMKFYGDRERRTAYALRRYGFPVNGKV